MIPSKEHALIGLEPESLLAFLALLGFLRCLEEVRPDWRPRVGWSIDSPPLRPVLYLREAVDQAEVCAAASNGAAQLAVAHAFGGKADLNHTVGEAREWLDRGRHLGGYDAELIAALICDCAVKVEQGKPTDRVEATPLCLLFGQGHQHFLQRLAAVPNEPAPPPRRQGKRTVEVSAEDCVAEALFAAWVRLDKTFSFRWDPAEDVRYALMYGDPSVAANKEGAQHGANRLAAIGLSQLPVVPLQQGGQVRLSLPGGARDRGFSIAWPIWPAPISLQAIRNRMVHPGLHDAATQESLGIDHVRVARRISVGKFMNFTAASVE